MTGVRNLISTVYDLKVSVSTGSGKNEKETEVMFLGCHGKEEEFQEPCCECVCVCARAHMCVEFACFII